MFELDYVAHGIEDWETISHDAFMGSLVRGRDGIYYFNVPCAFDIETSSFYNDEGEKQACMYIWQFGINGHCIIGRTWDEFAALLENLQAYLGLSDTQRLIIYVHNLSYEFEWLLHRLNWQRVFCLQPRKPIYARTVEGFEFRCSYLLSGLSLERLGLNLLRYPVRKMSGDLDYKKIRTSKTPLTSKELLYCVNDVLVVMSYIQELIEDEGNISKIPLTKTGFVRRFCRTNCLKSKKYDFLMEQLQITTTDEFRALQRAFAGGFTHANVLWSNTVCKDVSSFDFTSSYPTVMVSEMFPMSGATLVHPKSREEMNTFLRGYCCLFDVRFHNIRCKTIVENPISVSKCFEVEGVRVNNGRVVRADTISITLTDVDWGVIDGFYEWDSLEIGGFWIYKRGYLPTELVTCVLSLYSDKTTLKGVAGKESEYMRKKSMINAVYGMCVTNPVRDENTVENGEWVTHKADFDKAIIEYNVDERRFLFYPWGVWITAYARRNLFTGIAEFKNDYIYSDTDSLKVMHAEKHRQYIEWYNDLISKKLFAACEVHGLDFELTRPKTIRGIQKPLGVWDYEGTYSRFKTLGAKRYLFEDSGGDLHLTVSGLSKKKAVEYLLKEFGTNDAVFEHFQDGLYFPPCATGKNTHTYVDDGCSGIVTDYLGNAAEYNEYSFIHLQEADYNLSLAAEYIKYLMGVRHE